MTTTPTWYDLLGVDRDASGDEIRAAWRRAIDDLDPTDRRFRSLNKAAEVLLDPAARATYDAALPAELDDDLPDDIRGDEIPSGTPATTPAAREAAPGPAPARTRVKPAADRADRTEDADGADKADRATVVTTSGPRLPVVAGRWLITLGVLAALTGTAAGISIARHGAGGDIVTVANSNDSVSTADANQPLSHDYVTTVEADGAAALAAAKTAVVPVLSYDYRHMDESRQRAEAYLTDAYRAKYDQLFALLKQNAPGTQTVVTTNAPVDAGVVRVSGGRVEVLLFVDRPTTNKLHKSPINYQDQVTVTMVEQDGRWLVDDMQTS